MPRAIWSGSVSFGLVNVPVKLVTATSPKDVRFHQLHDADGGRINQKRVCSVDGEEVEYGHIVKGYDLGGGRYVVIEPEELASIDAEATRTIDIEEFVDLADIDPVFFEQSYYLVPDGRAEKPYALLAEAMARTGRWRSAASCCGPSSTWPPCGPGTGCWCCPPCSTPTRSSTRPSSRSRPPRRPSRASGSWTWRPSWWSRCRPSSTRPSTTTTTGRRCWP